MKPKGTHEKTREVRVHTRDTLWILPSHRIAPSPGEEYVVRQTIEMRRKRNRRQRPVGITAVGERGPACLDEQCAGEMRAQNVARDAAKAVVSSLHAFFCVSSEHGDAKPNGPAGDAVKEEAVPKATTVEYLLDDDGEAPGVCPAPPRSTLSSMPPALPYPYSPPPPSSFRWNAVFVMDTGTTVDTDMAVCDEPEDCASSPTLHSDECLDDSIDIPPAPSMRDQTWLERWLSSRGASGAG